LPTPPFMLATAMTLAGTYGLPTVRENALCSFVNGPALGKGAWMASG
jgi:hypothetical protein